MAGCERAVGRYERGVRDPRRLRSSRRSARGKLVGPTYSQARRQIDLLAYAMLSLPEQHTDLTSRLKEKAAASCRIRIALADPDCEEVAQRDAHEQLGGALPARIRTTIAHLREVWDFPNIELRFHCVPLYNATYRFDNDMLVTPYVYTAHGFQHPLLHLRRLGPDGIFAISAISSNASGRPHARRTTLQQVLSLT
jgi:hypothetical protein